MVGKQEGVGHSPHHLQPRPEHDQGSHFGESSDMLVSVGPVINPVHASGWPCLLFKQFCLPLMLLCHCRVSGTKCVPCTPISPSTWSSRRAAPWSRSGTSWERSTFAVSEWGVVSLCHIMEMFMRMARVKPRNIQSFWGVNDFVRRSWKLCITSYWVCGWLDTNTCDTLKVKIARWKGPQGIYHFSLQNVKLSFVSSVQNPRGIVILKSWNSHTCEAERAADWAKTANGWFENQGSLNLWIRKLFCTD